MRDHDHSLIVVFPRELNECPGDPPMKCSSRFAIRPHEIPIRWIERFGGQLRMFGDKLLDANTLQVSEIHLLKFIVVRVFDAERFSDDRRGRTGALQRAADDGVYLESLANALSRPLGLLNAE